MLFVSNRGNLNTNVDKVRKFRGTGLTRLNTNQGGPRMGVGGRAPTDAKGLNFFDETIVKNANFSVKFQKVSSYFRAELHKIVEKFQNCGKHSQFKTNLHKILDLDKALAKRIEK